MGVVFCFHDYCMLECWRDILHIQEPKIHKDIDGIMIYVWGSRRCVRECVPSDGASGGRITILSEVVLQLK